MKEMANYEVIYDEESVYVTIDVSRFRRFHIVPYPSYIILYYNIGYTRIRLPVEIIPFSAKITVKNGVMDAVFSRLHRSLSIFM